MYDILERILKRANKSFNREAHLNLGAPPSFNILRVLSAYKDECPNNNVNVYNAITKIMQDYNPKSMEEWYSAIQDCITNNRIVCSSKKLSAKKQKPIQSFRQENSSRSSANTNILLKSLIRNCHQNQKTDLS